MGRTTQSRLRRSAIGPVFTSADDRVRRQRRFSVIRPSSAVCRRATGFLTVTASPARLDRLRYDLALQAVHIRDKGRACGQASGWGPGLGGGGGGRGGRAGGQVAAGATALETMGS